MPANQRDINGCEGRVSLSFAVRQFQNAKTNGEIKREEIEKYKKDITTVYSGPEGAVYIPHSTDASTYLGRGTRWCTAATKSHNYFDQYNQDGPLYVLMFKDGTKWQLHLETMQFMNEDDQELDWDVMGKSPLFNKIADRFFQHITSNALESLCEVRSRGEHPTRMFKQLLPKIAQDVYAAYSYACCINRYQRWHPGEAAIATNADVATNYAVYIIHGPWPEAERVIATSPEDASFYAQKALKTRFLLAEPLMKKEADRHAENTWERDIWESYCTRWGLDKETGNPIPS